MISIAINQSTDKFIEYQGKRYKITADGEVYRRYDPPQTGRASYWDHMKNSDSDFCREVKRAAGVLKDDEKKSETPKRPGHYKIGIRG